MFWEVVGYSDKDLEISGRLDYLLIDKYAMGEEIKRVRFRCYIECDKEIQAAMVALEVFDLILKVLILSSGTAYEIRMERPRQICLEQLKGLNIRILSYDSQKKYPMDSLFVEPYKVGLLRHFEIDEINEWLDIVQQYNEDSVVKRFIELYCRGTRLAKISTSAGYLDFMKIIEYTIDKKYRKELEIKKSQQADFKQISAFSVEFEALLTKYFPNSSDAKKTRMVKEIAPRLFSRMPIQNKELLEYTCEEGGFYKMALSERMTGLESIINEKYGHWSEEERREHIEKLFEDFKEYIEEISKTLYHIRGGQVAHIRLSEEIEVDNNTLLVCVAIAHHLLSELIKGNIVLNNK